MSDSLQLRPTLWHNGHEGTGWRYDSILYVPNWANDSSVAHYIFFLKKDQWLYAETCETYFRMLSYNVYIGKVTGHDTCCNLTDGLDFICIYRSSDKFSDLGYQSDLKSKTEKFIKWYLEESISH